MTLSEIGGRIKRAKAKNFSNGCAGFSGCCPAHEDKDPSFAVWETADHWLHFKCQNKCSEDEILAALGMTQNDRRTTEYDQGMPPKPPETSYVYEDAQGQALFKKVRFYMKDPDHPNVWKKGFKQCGMNGESNLNHLNGKSKVLYNWPDVINAVRDGSTVYVNEGEKACELMEIAGLCATCQPGGAGKDRPETKWLPEHTEALRGAKKVVVVADRDEVGEVYASYVASAIRGVVGSVTIVQSAVDKPKADAFDHFEKGFSVDQFVVRRDLMPKRGLAVVEFGEDFEPETPEFLVEPYLPKGKCVLLDADGGTQKSSLMLAIAAGLSAGVTPVTFAPMRPARTLYMHRNEDLSKELNTVYAACGGKAGLIKFHHEPIVLDSAGIESIRETIEDNGIDLVVFDALFYFLQGSVRDVNVAMDVIAVMERLNGLASSTGCTVVNIRHTSKGVVGKSASELGMGSVQFRNSHRGQMVARWHPHRKGIVVVTDEKGSILVPKGDHFCFQRRGNAIDYVPLPNPFDKTDADYKELTKTEQAENIIRRMCEGAWASVDEIGKVCAQAGISDATVSRVRSKLKLMSRKSDVGGPWELTLPDPDASLWDE